MFQAKRHLPSVERHRTVPILFPGNRWAFEAGGLVPLILQGAASPLSCAEVQRDERGAVSVNWRLPGKERVGVQRYMH